MNKSLVTNLLSGVIIGASFALPQPYDQMLLYAGLFALSGAITNQIAIHMLFEKVPGLYGSGVIERNFGIFKESIGSMVMEQFFTDGKISDMLDSFDMSIELEPIIDNADFSVAFEALTQSVMESKFGSMVQMVGGEGVFDALEEPFIKKLKSALHTIINSESFKKQLLAESKKQETSDLIRAKIKNLVDTRLDDLSPRMVKELVSKLIKNHMGWLVVWGGVFGGIIGLVSSLAMSLLS